LSNEKKDNKIVNTLIKIVKGLGYPLFAIIVAIFVSVFFVIWSKGYSVLQYFSALRDLFSVIWKGSFGSKMMAMQTLEYVTPLIFTGVANAVAFRTGLFNIGVEGQFLMGMMAAAILGTIHGLSPFIHIPLVIIGGMLAGGIWAAIPGYLKARFGINEVINTIMMNYIGMNFANFLILRTRFGVADKSATPLIQKSAELLRFSTLSRVNLGIIIGIIMAFFIYWLLWKTTVGYELRAVGINPHGAEYGGISIAKNTVLAMVFSGALAGMGGAVHISGILHQVQNFMALPGFGFDGMAVALLAKSNPIACLFSAVLFGALNSSSKILQLNSIPKEIVYLIQSIIIVFVATDYIVKYVSEKRKKKVMING
jgi:general nucleoside transport system permease protein